jgi:hypothetical protein
VEPCHGGILALNALGVTSDGSRREREGIEKNSKVWMGKYGNNLTFFHVDRHTVLYRHLRSAPSCHCLSAACAISVKRKPQAPR